MSNNTILKALERMGLPKAERRGTAAVGHRVNGVVRNHILNHAHIELQLAHQERDE
jgi:hypothetical protein